MMRRLIYQFAEAQVYSVPQGVNAPSQCNGVAQALHHVGVVRLGDQLLLVRGRAGDSRVQLLATFGGRQERAS